MPAHGDVHHQRWLVPEGQLDLTVHCTPDRLRRGRPHTRSTEVGSTQIRIEERQHRIELVIPAAPADAELERLEQAEPAKADVGK